ncbi:alpha/beta hydrolase [Halomonas urumqiensis]|uniref:Carboxylesterase n=1 Tax=Halomonas urumqiensis TaxID=1684789 RepID=A0A2N7UD49_9GAMM|nr:alpha/beta fold hydrolase [Halomonas urumqiensis]PMR78350.1 carboxylesterase [Halomonas urumqiensis]PTB03497.1 carboxylesterase [Halomonas urumqiensis]GHE20315.1 carboxylesterase [Halomonas urumqiensis]
MSQPGELFIEPRNGKSADACVFILHGLGADGHDFEPLVPALALPSDASVRFIMPHAPRLPVTINGGMVMPAWYDLLEMNLGRRVDEPQLKASAKRIQELIREQIETGIDSRRIILAGFSQGGAVAYQAALSFEKPLGGLLAMSTYFATADSIELAEANRELPIEVHHGSFDPVVPEALGREGFDAVKAKGYPANYRLYPMAHALCPQQIADIGKWLTQRLA